MSAWNIGDTVVPISRRGKSPIGTGPSATVTSTWTNTLNGRLCVTVDHKDPYGNANYYWEDVIVTLDLTT